MSWKRCLLLGFLTMGAVLAMAAWIRHDNRLMCVEQQTMDIACRNAPWYKEMMRTGGTSAGA
jgi:hypothetical protein